MLICEYKQKNANLEYIFLYPSKHKHTDPALTLQSLILAILLGGNIKWTSIDLKKINIVKLGYYLNARSSGNSRAIAETGTLKSIQKEGRNS